MASSAVVGVAVARYLGPGDFGLYSFAISAVGLMLPLVQAGAPLVLQELSANPGARHRTLATSFVAMSLGAAIALLLCAGIVVSLGGGELAGSRALVAVAAIALVARPLYVVEGYFYARHESWPAVSVRIVGLLLGAVLKVGAVVVGLGTLALVTAGSIEVVASGVLLLAVFRRRDGIGLQIRTTWPAVRGHLRRVIPFALAGITASIYMRIDQLMVTAIAGPVEAGTYAAAVRISEVAYLLPLAASIPLSAELGRTFSTNRAAFDDRLQAVFVVMCWGALLVALPLAVWSSTIIELSFGPAYAPAAPVLALHAFSNVFVAMGVAQTAWTVNAHLERFALAKSLAGGVLNIGLNLILIPRYGALGAAIATLASYGVAAMLANVALKEGRRILRMQVRALLPWTAGRIVLQMVRTWTVSASDEKDQHAAKSEAG